MSASEIMNELEGLGSNSIKKVLLKHGAREPFYGVKIEHLKQIQKRIGTDYALALELYATGVSDAMYLAGLIVDDGKMTEQNLQDWLDMAYWSLLSESTVPWVAAGGKHGMTMARRWIEFPVETTAAAGWCTISGVTLVTGDADLNMDELKMLLHRVRDTIHNQPNRVRSAMNGFVIAVGTNVAVLTEEALACAEAIGPVTVDVGDTACKVAYAPDYIKKAISKGAVGKKRKTCKC